ncbi:MAG TPA: cache domain-containing protein [candidate division Zixibacteria bacterium]|nr:cache domain-containing protein [candidate division Zixibacteria bacterium]
MKQLLRILAVMILLAAWSFAAEPKEERGTPNDAKQMVNDAITHIKEVGLDKAYQDFSTPGGKWHNKDIYLFCYKFDGTNVCHGANKALIGKNLLDLKTADGQLLIQNLIDIAKNKGTGWITYQWPHPVTKKTETKKAYVARIPGTDALVGSGAYPQ